MKFLDGFIFLVLVVTGCSCYQIHSDDDLRTVPATNNPHVIQDKTASTPSIGY